MGPRASVDRLKVLFLSCGGLGFAPVAPEVLATLAGAGLALALGLSDHYLLWAVVVGVLIYAGARSLGTWCEEQSGRRDPGYFVIGEALGYLVSVLWVTGPSLLTLVVAFFLVRLFSVLALPPVPRLKLVPGADGILLGKLASGLWGLALLTLGRFLFPELPWIVAPVAV
ncbi:MAG: phosphatidylglycerophosphatase A [Planctomycetota bacterium]